MKRWKVLCAVGAACCAALCGCVSVPVERSYVEPEAAAPAAVVINQGHVGGATTTCQLPGSSRVCRAWLLAVDQKILSWSGNSMRVGAGVHDVVLSCQSWSGAPMMFGKMSMIDVAYRGPFEATREYFVRCVLENGAAHVWLAASADGAPLPGFTPASGQH